MKKTILLLSLIAFAVTANAFASSSISCPTSVNVGSQLKVTVYYDPYEDAYIKGFVTEIYTTKASSNTNALASEVKAGPYMILLPSPVHVFYHELEIWSDISVLPSTVPSVLKGKTIDLTIHVINNGGEDAGSYSSVSCWIKVN